MDYPYVLGNGGGLPGGLFGKMARNQRYILNNADVAEGFAPKLLQPRNSSGKPRLHQEAAVARPTFDQLLQAGRAR